MTDLTLFTPPTGRQGLANIIRGEVTKLRTLRSTTWTILATVVAALLVTALAANHVAGRPRMSFREADSTPPT